jgi:YVTN family beta-propeller protein
MVLAEPAPDRPERVTFPAAMWSRMRTFPEARRGALTLLGGVLGFVLALALASPATAGHGGKDRKLHHVLFVGNNWDGTVDVVSPRGKFRRIARINIVPDLDERMLEIATDPVRLGYFLGIRTLVGEGHDQFADDMYTTPDGRLLIISRPSLRDVVGINLKTEEIVWRFVVDGQRSDHMAISPDGKRVAVSASTGNVVHILNTRTGKEVGRFPSGDSPHENNYSKDGTKIFHASIGLVYTPADQPQLDSTKGDRWFQVVDAESLKILKRIDMGQKLEEAGYPNMSAAVRPMAHSPNERWFYLQVSFFHGFVEYDLKKDRVRRVANLPLSDEAKETPREGYLLDSAHHGIAMNKKGTKLCVAGTMSDYAAIVSRKTFRYKLIHGGKKPYWSTNSFNSKYCFVSWSGSDRISVIDYKKRKEIARVPVGYHPQRMRMGHVRRSWLADHRARPPSHRR